MDLRTRNIIKAHVTPYIESITNQKIGKKDKTFVCPKCKAEKPSASIYPENSGRVVCYRPECNINEDIFGLVKKIENMPTWSDEDVKSYLVRIFKIKLPTDNYKYLPMYQKLGWCLFPVSPNTKFPVESDWQNSQYRNVEQWKEWIDQGLNIGLNLKHSSTVVLDVDDMSELDKIIDKEKNLKLKDIIGDTLQQTTKKGLHVHYLPDPDFFKTLNKLLKNDGFNIELRVAGAYTLISPSTSGGELREWNDKPIIKMPEELKAFFMKYYNLEPKRENTVDQGIQEAIDEEKLGDIQLHGLEGMCNDAFIRLFGVMRKYTPRDILEKNAYNFNKILKDPFPAKTIRSMLEQVNKYRTYDKKELGKLVLAHLDTVEEGTAFELATSLRYEKKDVEDVLKYLLDENLIYKQRGRWKSFKKAAWRDTFIKESARIDFKMPYFDEYAIFRQGDMIVIGAAPGIGKSTISINIMKKLVEQGIKPYYINLESGNRFVSIATQLGLKEGDFRWVNHYNPQSIELEDRGVTIIDWLLCENHAETDQMYKRLSEQLDRHSGNLIVLTQLKEMIDPKTKEVFYCFYAENQLKQFPAFVVQYEYQINNGVASNEFTLFRTKKIRESKINKQKTTIPTIYSHDTKLLELRK